MSQPQSRPDEHSVLVLGGLHLLNGTAPRSASDVVVLVPLSEPAHLMWSANTTILRWAAIGEVELRARTMDGTARSAGRSTGAELFDRLLPGSQLREVVAELRSGAPGQYVSPGLCASPLVPMFLVAVRPRFGGGSEVHISSQIRFLDEDACFIRTTPDPVHVPDLDAADWLVEALDRHARDFLFLNNHQRYYKKCFPGRELEYKYTINPPTADIWTLTAVLYQRLRDSALPGYVPEYRDEFQAWDYTNHLFQVTGPEPDRGYVSFIPTTDGRNLVKRKWFSADTFDRRESHTYGVDVDGGFDAYVTEELGVSAVRLPSFRRARYDVNFESLASGHVYGIFFDTVSLMEAPEVKLQQCELEYLRSRTVIEPDDEVVLTEIAEIAAWLEDFLREHGLPAERGYYSKLSFLLDSVAARPELAVAVGR